MASHAHSNSTHRPTPTKTLDLNGVTSPGPLFTVRSTMAEMKDGEVLLFSSDSPGIESDIYAWTAHTNNQVLGVDRTGPNGFSFYVMKGDPFLADKTLDTLGKTCPIPIMEANKVLMTMKSGEVLKLLSNCPAAPIEVQSWLKGAAQKTLLGMTEDVRGVCRFYIRR